MKTTERDVAEEIVEESNEIEEILQKVLPYWRLIAGAVVLLITAVVLINFITTNQRKAKEAGWTEFFGAAASQDPAALQDVATRRSDSEVGPWAQQAAAQANLSAGTNLLSTDRESAKKSLTEAVSGFEKTLEQAGKYELIQQRSLWGLAQAHESLNDLPKAKDYLNQVVTGWPDSELAKRAKDGIARLDAPATKEFYDWFYAQTPKSIPLPGGVDIPNLPLSVPNEPDVTIPDPADTGSNETGNSETTEPVTEIATTEAAATEAVTTESATTEATTTEAVAE